MNFSAMFSLTQRLADGETLTSSSRNESYILRIYIFHYKLYTILWNFISTWTPLDYRCYVNNGWNEPENVCRNFQILLDIAKIVRILARPIIDYINKSRYLVGPFLPLAASLKPLLILHTNFNNDVECTFTMNVLQLARRLLGRSGISLLQLGYCRVFVTQLTKFHKVSFDARNIFMKKR